MGQGSNIFSKATKIRLAAVSLPSAPSGNLPGTAVSGTCDDASLIGPDSPDGLGFSQGRAPISAGRSGSYAGSGVGALTDATGEREDRRFRQRFRGLRVCRPNPNGESGIGGGSPAVRKTVTDHLTRRGLRHCPLPLNNIDLGGTTNDND